MSAAPPPSADEQVLTNLGYKPQLARRMSGFGNFALSFSVISVLSGCMTLFYFGLNTGGPAVMIWGWTVVGLMVVFVGLALAEVTSAYPTAGALYFMAGKLRGPRWAHYTGWFNLLGLLGGMAAGPYGCALFIGAWLNLSYGFTPTPVKTFLIFAGLLLLLAVMNLFGVHLVSMLNSISVWWHLGGVAAIVAALVFIPDHHQSAGFVFGEFTNNTGWGNPLYVGLLGLLLAQYTFSGYDASAHLSEETERAQTAAAKGIVHSIVWSWVAGFILLAGLLFAIQDYNGTINSATGVPPAQIFLDALGPSMAKILLLVVIIAQIFCANAGMTSASRMIFAFSRDGALPFARKLRRTSLRTKTPVNAVWLAAIVPLLLAAPALFSTTAYTAITTINVIGITPAYAIPIFLRLRRGKQFKPGTWHLGRWSKPVGWIAVTWVAFVTVLLCLPSMSPVTVDTFNYAPVTLVVMLALAWAAWHWGLRHDIVPEYGTASERDRMAEDLV
ncbi:amino acid permease [Streptomyces sp. NBC_00637]|uniref:amino acid permease n=1 Tax=Streptomyces sp. NBC_00637 TaxID=2903667 RepID=UPI00386967CB